METSTDLAMIGSDDDYVEFVAEQDVEIQFPENVYADEVVAAVSGIAGADGDSWYYDTGVAGGPDVAPELDGRGKYDAYRRMRASDPAVRSLEWLFKLPVRSAEWKIDPVSEDPVDLLVADLLGMQFGLSAGKGSPSEHLGGVGHLDLTWDESLAQALLCVPYGAMGEELVWDDEQEWRDRNGDPVDVRPLARLAPRHASTIADIEVDRKTGKIRRVRQDVYGTGVRSGAETWIPGEKLAWYVIEKEGSNWYGTSLLRAAYGPWKQKTALMLSAGIGYDRWLAGIPKVRRPAGGTPADARKAQNIGKNLRQHERGYVSLEGSVEDGWDVEIMTATINDPTPMLRLYDEQIAKAGLQQFSSLGTTERGSRAVGEVLADPYYMAVSVLANGIAQSRMRQPFRRFVDVNFGPQVRVPTLRVSKIQGRNVAVLARAMADLTSAGMSFTDRDTQNDVRDQLDLRHLPDEVAAAVAELPEDVGLRGPPGVGEGDGLGA